MALNFAWILDGSHDSIRFQPMERLEVYLFGATVLFASFGMGEAVYRLLFSEFDGATDRIPVEVLFGLVFAWIATKFGGVVYRNRKEISSREPCTSNPQLLVDEAKLSEPDLQVSYFEQLFGIATCDTTVTAWQDYRSTA